MTMFKKEKKYSKTYLSKNEYDSNITKSRLYYLYRSGKNFSIIKGRIRFIKKNNWFNWVFKLIKK